MVLVSLDRTSDVLAVVRHGGRFGLNMLESGQVEIAKRFARKGTTRFDHVCWELDADLPRLAGASGWVACSVEKLIEGGDHVVALGLVLAAESVALTPLTDHARTFGTHTRTDGGAT